MMRALWFHLFVLLVAGIYFPGLAYADVDPEKIAEVIIDRFKKYQLTN